MADENAEQYDLCALASGLPHSKSALLYHGVSQSVIYRNALPIVKIDGSLLYIADTMAENIFEELAEFEKKIGLPKGFYNALLAEDDWSFVIKLNALFEAAATHALVARLDTPELLDTLARLDFARQDCGKIKLLKKLGIISPEQAKCLQRLAELRNDLAHGIENVTFNFKEYFSKADSSQRKNIVRDFGHGLYDPLPLTDTVKVSKAEFVELDTKQALWLTALEILACMHLEYERTELRKLQLVVGRQASQATGLLSYIAEHGISKAAS